MLSARLVARNIDKSVVAEVNVCIIGDCKVGKTAITRAFTQCLFSDNYVPTIGSDFETRLFEVDGNFFKVHLHDISGQEAFLWMARKPMQIADAFIYCYDLTNYKSFESIPKWFEQLQKCAKHPNLPKLILGNKLDLRHKQTVPAIEAKEFGIPNGMKQFEISAKTAQNLNAAFYILCNDILKFRRLGGRIPIGNEDIYHLDITHIHEVPSNVQDITDTSDYTNVFRILLLGSVRTGKTALRLRYCRNYYSPEYIASSGLDYSTRTVMVDGEKVKVQIWDVSGDGIYNTLRRGYYKGANAFIIVYDLTNKESFTNAEYLVKDLDMHEKSECPKLVIGNKCDKAKSKRAVSEEQAQEWAAGWRIPVLEVSAKRSKNVDAAFHKLIIALKQQYAPWKKIYDFS